MNVKVKNGVTTMTMHATEQRTVKSFCHLLELPQRHGEPKWRELATVLAVGVQDIEAAFCDPKLFDEKAE